ncbi:MAG: M1 family aminopeptidase, partial [Telluria sp.]
MNHTLCSLIVAAVFGALLLTSPALAAPRAENAWLTQAEAQARAARVSQVEYAMTIDLTGNERFNASSTISFDLKSASEALTIDLDKAAISTLTVNGKAVTPHYNGWFLTIAPTDLAAGRNTVALSYTRTYNTNGEGLHRMIDPADGKVYLFSQLAPANAHQVFALFDQPDMKASYALTVTAPASWQVVSAARESTIADMGATRRWTFPATKRMSAYAFSLHAGPYKVWEDNSGAYPLRLFARQSVAAHVPAADWFRHTQYGFAFFDRYFGIPYQFGKYDQLLVPDHLYGAMENIGAVTFAERSYLHKAAMTPAQRESMARVIMHEMAHQWFGDLVTMQ